MQIVECRHGAVSASGSLNKKMRSVVIEIQFDHGMPERAKYDMALFDLKPGRSTYQLRPAREQSYIPAWLIEAIKNLPFQSAHLSLIINGAGSVTIIGGDSPRSYGYESNDDVIRLIVFAVADGLETVETGV